MATPPGLLPTSDEPEPERGHSDDVIGDRDVDELQTTTTTRKGSSAVAASTGFWKLKYRDFLPSPVNKMDEFSRKSQPFKKLMSRANDWLRKNSDVSVLTCETITWTSPDETRLGDGELMVLRRDLREQTNTYHIRGLRLWLVPRLKARCKCDCLDYEDFVPLDDDTIHDVILKVNCKLRQKTLGRLLTVETIASPVIKGRIRNRATRWRECSDDDSAYVFILRLFFSKGTRRHLTPADSPILRLGIKDVVPMATEDDGSYETFEMLTNRMNAWLKEDENRNDVISVINMQSLMVQKQQDCRQQEIGVSCRFSIPGVNNPDPVEIFRILRLSYLRRGEYDGGTIPESVVGETGSSHVTGLGLYLFTYETFTPELIRDESLPVERFERMRETFSKVIAYLHNSGADVICIETVVNPMQVFSNDPQEQNHTNNEDELNFLLTIRLYLAVDSSHSSLHPIIQRCFSTTNICGDGGATRKVRHRSSPLFLRSVVTRNFKFRWILLAVSAFTSMTIIALISIFYSNIW